MISWYFWVLLSLKISKHKIDLTFNAKIGRMSFLYPTTIIHHLCGDPWLSQLTGPQFFLFFCGSKTRLRSGSRSNGIRAAEYPNVVNVGASPWLAHQEANAPMLFVAIPQPWSSIKKQTAQQLNTFRIFRLVIRII